MQIPEGYILIKREEYDKLITLVIELENRVKVLEEKLHLSSHNSHKPPSSDGLKRTIKNNRIKGERKTGGQQGHPGNTLEMVETPDKIIEHKVSACAHCGIGLSEIAAVKYHRRQVFDIPAVQVEVTEHRIDVKLCPVCGKQNVAHCEVPASVQYGEGVKSMVVYLNQYQMLPLERVSETMNDLFNCPLSAEVIQQSSLLAYQQLEEIVEQDIKTALLQSPVMHNDETGIRCEGKTKWIHTASTQDYTYYAMDDKRGKEAMDRIGILPLFHGTSMHDRLGSYDHYDHCFHVYCHAHLLRDLSFVEEECGKPWAKEMKELTLKALRLKKRDLISEQVISIIEQGYDQIIQEGLKQEPAPIHIPGKRGRKGKGKSLSLLEFYRDKKQAVLHFLHAPDIPFDNNLAERDLRMVKLKQKISGCFRTQKGADVFCRIRSYISTIRKQNKKVWQSLKIIISPSSPSVSTLEI
jgi:transposase